MTATKLFNGSTLFIKISTSGTGNVNTGVPAFELAALGAAAVGGLAAMAITVRKNNK